MRVLLTGFEAFDGERINPSAQCVETLAASPPAGMDLRALVLPVESAAVERVLAAIDAQDPQAVLLLGEAGGRARVTPERIAINVDDFRIPDHAGRQPRGEPVVAGGPAAYLSTLPVAAMVASLERAGIPSEVSNSAGTYVCNHVFYRVMHDLARRGRDLPAGFVHLPYAHEQVRGKPGAIPSLAAATLVSAVTVCLQSLLP